MQSIHRLLSHPLLSHRLLNHRLLSRPLPCPLDVVTRMRTQTVVVELLVHLELMLSVKRDNHVSVTSILARLILDPHLDVVHHGKMLMLLVELLVLMELMQNVAPEDKDVSQTLHLVHRLRLQPNPLLNHLNHLLLLNLNPPLLLRRHLALLHKTDICAALLPVLTKLVHTEVGQLHNLVKLV